MPLKEIADKAVDQINESIAASLSDDERTRITQIVEHAIVDAASQLQLRYEDVVKAQSGPEADMAHKIAEEMRREQDALIANLSALR